MTFLADSVGRLVWWS